MTNQEFAQGLRELAEIYERDERMAQPDRLELHLFTSTGEQFRDSVKALALGGVVDKIEPKEGDYFYRVQRTLSSGLVVRLTIDRSAVCRKVRKMAMVDTWECGPILEAEHA